MIQRLWMMALRRGLTTLVRKLFGINYRSPRRPRHPTRPGRNKI